MAKDLNKALEAVEMTYGQIKEIADSMLSGPFEEPNRIVEFIQFNVESMSIDMLRDSILRLQLAVYALSELRDRSGVKAICAEAIKKEAYAANYISQEGTAGVKDSNTTLAISENIIAQCLYDLVASLTKTKVDQLHRMIDSLKSILMSRMQEAKFMQMSTTADGSNPYAQQSTRQILNENY
jgi:hypothetical protein